MSKVRGILDKAYQGKGGYWSVNVNEVWYGCYKSDYTALEGQEVEFDAEQKGKYWNVKGDVTPVPGGTAPAASAAPASAGNTQAAQDRQMSIVLQSSFKTAAEAVGALIAADKISLGAKNAAFDNALGLVEEAALRIYRHCISPADFVADEPAPGPEGDDYEPTKA